MVEDQVYFNIVWSKENGARSQENSILVRFLQVTKIVSSPEKQTPAG